MSNVEYACNRCMDTGFLATHPNTIRCPEPIHGQGGMTVARTGGGGGGGWATYTTPPLRYMGPPLTPGKPGDAGIDLPAAEEVVVQGFSFGTVPIEVSVELPRGYWGWIIQRSSTFWRKRLMVNQAVIDNGYRGKLFVAVYNLNDMAYHVDVGERLAQLVLVPLVEPSLIHLTPDEFSTETARGTTGFGSTG